MLPVPQVRQADPLIQELICIFLSSSSFDLSTIVWSEGWREVRVLLDGCSFWGRSFLASHGLVGKAVRWELG